MFYLGATTPPTTLQEFSSAIEAGLREGLILSPNRSVVQTTGSFPNLDALTIDLTGSRVDTTKRPPAPPRGTGHPQPAVSARQFRVFAHPIELSSARITVDLTASDAQLVYDRDATGKLVLLPANCRDGQFSVEISKSDLEALMLAQAKANAARQGATITGLELALKSQGERSLSAHVRASAKKMLFSGVVHLFGTADVRDDLTARLWGLDVRGEGMAGTMAAGLLKPKLQQFEGREIPLANYAFAGVQLRDVRVASVDPLRLTASFGA